MITKIYIRAAVVLAAILAVSVSTLSAQHTLAVVGGGGMTSGRLYPSQEKRGTWGVFSGGLSWRYYSAPRFVGGIGVDLEFMQRGFSFSPDAWRYEEKEDYHYYTRIYNTVSVPVVWQPHVYMFRNHVRLYLEAMLNLEYNLSATFKNEVPASLAEGKYTMYNYRDNHFGYGLAGGGGIDILVGRIEFGFRVRYYFGLSDVMRNRNKYYDNGLDDPAENPFSLTPLRSPVDNLMMSFKVGFRFNKGGFNEWNIQKPKRDKNRQKIQFSLDGH